MKSRIITGAVITILGLLIAIGPQTIFPVCGIRENTMGDNAMGDSAAAHGAMGDNAMGDNAMGENAGGSKMKCYWAGQAEIGAGGVIALIGILLLVFKDRSIRAGLTLALVPLGIYALLIVNVLIGVCGSAHMECRTLTLPAITILGIAVSVISLVNAFFLLRDENRKA